MGKGRKPAGCPICAHAACVQITSDLTSGVDALVIVQKYAVTTRHLAKHLEHLGAVVARRGSASAPEASTPPGAKVAKVVPLRATTCLVCAHPQRQEIDGELLKGRAASTVARRFLIDVAAVRVHMRERIDAEERERARAARSANDASTIDVDRDDRASALERARAQVNRLRDLRIRFGEEEHVDAAAIVKIEEAEGAAIQRYARLTGELGPVDEKRLIGTPQFQRVMAEIVAELEPHPEIAQRVAERLARIVEVS